MNQILSIDVCPEKVISNQSGLTLFLVLLVITKVAGEFCPVFQSNVTKKLATYLHQQIPMLIEGMCFIDVFTPKRADQYDAARMVMFKLFKVELLTDRNKPLIEWFLGYDVDAENRVSWSF